MTTSNRSALVAAALTLCGGAHAQSNVTIYGLLDVGLTYIDNVNGKSRKAVDSGESAATRLGFRGTEDLGGGLSAVFTLEHQIRIDEGAAQNAASFWNRGAFVGLSSKDFGTLTVGRQIDIMNTDLPPDSAPLLTGGLAAGWQSVVGLQLDAHYGTTAYDNTIKWKHQLGPVRFGLMYGFGRENRDDKLAGGFATYYNGPLSIGVGAMRDNYTTAVFARRTAAVKLFYRPPGWGFYANIARASDPRDRSSILPIEAGFLYDVTGNIVAGGGVGWARVTNRAGDSARLLQPFVGAKYKFSPRVDVFVMASRNSTSDRRVAPASVSVPGGAPGASSDDAQVGVRGGLRIFF